MAERLHLTIGEVLSLLRDEFPDVSISKIRFLESQGLVDPERTPSGYRKFYDNDVERLRWILRQQREHFLPLKVIKDRLADDTAAPEAATAPAPHAAGPTAAAPTGASLTPEAAPAAPGAAAVGTSPPGAAGGPSAPAPSASAPSPTSAPPSPTSAPPSPTSAPPSPTWVSPSPTGDRRPGEGRPAGDDPGTAAERVTPPAAGGAPGDAAARSSLHAPARPVVPGAAAAPTVPSPPVSAPSDAAPSDAAPSDSAPSAPRPSDPARSGAAPTPAPSAHTRAEGAATAAPAGATGRGGDVGSPDVYTVNELAEAVGCTAQLIRDLQQYGILVAGASVGGTPYFDPESLALARIGARFAELGVEPRHLRAWRNAADREAGLFEQLIMPLLRQRNPQARRQAAGRLDELTTLGGELRSGLIAEAIRAIR